MYALQFPAPIAIVMCVCICAGCLSCSGPLLVLMDSLDHRVQESRNPLSWWFRDPLHSSSDPLQSPQHWHNTLLAASTSGLLSECVCKRRERVRLFVSVRLCARGPRLCVPRVRACVCVGVFLRIHKCVCLCVCV